MLQAIDESLIIWGWQTGTGTRFAIITDVRGKSAGKGSLSNSEVRMSKGVTDADVRVVSAFLDSLISGLLMGHQAFKAIQTAYVRLLQNPFYVPDENTPMAVASGKGKGGQITSKKFIQEVKRIGDNWRPGTSAL